MTRLVSSTPMSSARFGDKITLWGNDTLVISVPGEQVSGKTSAGVVYLKFRGQSKMTRLVSPTPMDSARFGDKITLWGNDMLVISVLLEQVSGKPSAGAVYLKFRGQSKMTRLVSSAP